MQFRDLQTQYKKYKHDIDEAIQKVLSRGNFISGEEVKELEGILAEYVGVKHCITCANGTDALSLVLMAWNIGEGDAVFVPDFTFFATAEVVALRHATPIFVDVKSDTFNMDYEKLELVVEKVIAEGKFKPRAIISVDLFGLPANYNELERIAKKYNLLLLEDGAQGFGGSIKEKKACSFGDASTTSFFPAKPLGCYGDGGAIFTDNDDLADIISSIKVHGRGENKYDNIRIGINSRLDTLQAAILKIKFKAFINYELEQVNKIYNLYRNNLSGRVEIPIIPDGYKSSFAQFTIKLKSKEERNLIMDKLKNNSIPCMIYYDKPLHMQVALIDYLFNQEELEISSKLCETVLSLPMHPYLSEAEIKYICETINMCI